MKSFRLDENFTVDCEWKKTRMAFKHEATLYRDGIERDKTKICYQNRTWESYNFQSVLHKIIDRNFTGGLKEIFIKAVDAQGNGEDHFKEVKMISAFGNLLCDNDDDRSKFNKRIVGTIPGISFPDDFDNLPAEERKRRLNKALEVL